MSDLQSLAENLNNSKLSTSDLPFILQKHLSLGLTLSIVRKGAGDIGSKSVLVFGRPLFHSQYSLISLSRVLLLYIWLLPFFFSLLPSMHVFLFRLPLES